MDKINKYYFFQEIRIQLWSGISNISWSGDYKEKDLRSLNVVDLLNRLFSILTKMGFKDIRGNSLRGLNNRSVNHILFIFDQNKSLKTEFYNLLCLYFYELGNLNVFHKKYSTALFNYHFEFAIAKRIPDENWISNHQKGILNRCVKAIKNVEEIIITPGLYPVNFVELGNSYKTFDRVKALKNYHKALNLDQTYYEAYLSISLMYYEYERDADMAIFWINEYIKVISYDYRPYNDIAAFYWRRFDNACKGDIGKAIYYLKKAIDYNPNAAEPYINLGRAYQDSGDQGEADLCFEKAEELGSHTNVYSQFGKKIE